MGQSTEQLQQNALSAWDWGKINAGAAAQFPNVGFNYANPVAGSVSLSAASLTTGNVAMGTALPSVGAFHVHKR